MQYCAVDFETFYSSKDGYGLKQQTMWEYTRDTRFDAFMVSVHGHNNQGEVITFVGFPEAFNWEQLRGCTLICHNASFDGLVMSRIQELNLVPNIPFEYVCTADLAAFLRVPRNLKGATYHLLGKEMSKAVRTSMDGVRYRTLPPETQQSWLDYADQDAKMTFEIWEKYGDKWPEQERRISKQNRAAGWRGVAVDRDRLMDGAEMLHRVVVQAEEKMPWIDVEKEVKAGSQKGLRTYAREQGLTDVPASLKKDDPDMVAWVTKHRDQHPFIQARLDHSSAVPHRARLSAMQRLLDCENVIRFDLMYFGAHTGRLSNAGAMTAGKEVSSDKFNPLNIPKAPVFNVDIRGMLVPRKGYKFMIYDYNQVEARIILWLSKSDEMISRIRKENIYQVMAKVLGWFPNDGEGLKKKDPDTYALSKETVLGAGFGMSWKKFHERCIIKKMNVSPEQAKRAIYGWRDVNPKVVHYWGQMHELFKMSATLKDATHVINLNSWRALTYFAPELKMGVRLYTDNEGKQQSTPCEEMFASTGVHKPKVRFFGGKLTENVVQATARDIMYEGALAICEEQPEWFFLWNAYDEVIFEVPDCDVELAKDRIPHHLTTAAKWADGCPLDVEGGVFDRYTK